MKGRPHGSHEGGDQFEKEPGRQARRQRSEQHNRRLSRKGGDEERRARTAGGRIREWDDDWDDDGDPWGAEEDDDEA